LFFLQVTEQFVHVRCLVINGAVVTVLLFLYFTCCTLQNIDKCQGETFLILKSYDH